MFLRVLIQSFLRQQRRKLIAGTAVMLGMTVVTAMLAVSTQIGDRMSAEVRTLGANILVRPQADTLDVHIGGVNLKPADDGAYLAESDLVKIKQIFWALNIKGYSPMLEASVPIGGAMGAVPVLGTYFAKPVAVPNRPEPFVTGVIKTHPWWKVSGEWPRDDSQDVLLGKNLAARLKFKPGDLAYINNRETKISGILSTGGDEDNAVVAPIAWVQQWIGRPGAVRRVLVSAITKPEDDFARRNPKSLSPADLERWECSPYANSIAYQINQAIPSAYAEQIRAVAQNEGVLLSRITGLMLLIALAAIIASALAVSAAMATTIFERRQEVGLMRALGAAPALIGSLFYLEAAVIATIGGMVGFGLGSLLAQWVSQSVFSTAVQMHTVVLPVVLLLAVAIACFGSAASIRRAVHADPALVLRGDIA
jgi:putative ABC transport system permease protein